MVQKCPRKVFRNSGNCWISEMRTIQPKIPEIPEVKLNGKQTPGKNFWKSGYTSRGCPLLWKFWRMLCHSHLEVAENLKRTFWLNGKRPTSEKRAQKLPFILMTGHCPDLNSRDWLKQNFNQSEGRKLPLFLLIFYPPTDFAPHPTIWTPGKV